MHVLPAILCGVLGFVAGAPLQIIINRAPIHLRILGIPLHCSNCGTNMASNAQVSFVAMATRRNRCAACYERLWTSWPWVEICTAGLFALIAWRFGWAWALPAYLVFVAALFAITIDDLRNYVIPNRIVYPTLFASLVLLGIAAVINQSSKHIVPALIGMAGAWLFFFVFWLFFPRGMGFGDVRLSALIGLMAGWIGLQNVMIAIVLGLVLGALVGLLFMLVGFKGRRDPIPFGPFLAAGAVLGIVWGADISQFWLGS